MNFPNQASFDHHGIEQGGEHGLFPCFYEAAHDAIRVAYPNAMSQFGHHLASHAMLRRAAVAELAKLHPKALIEMEGGRETIEPGKFCLRAENYDTWMCLRQADREAGYDTLMRSALKEIKPIIAGISGPMLEPEARLILVSPHAKIPPLITQGHAIHFQLSGACRLESFSYEGKGDNLRKLHERALSGKPFDLHSVEDLWHGPATHELAPGQAILMPAFMPHRVATYDEVSLVLVLSWQSNWCVRYANACRLNARLRSWGADPDFARENHKRNSVKSLAWRVWQAWDWLSSRTNSSAR